MLSGKTEAPHPGLLHLLSSCSRQLHMTSITAPDMLSPSAIYTIFILLASLKLYLQIHPVYLGYQTGSFDNPDSVSRKMPGKKSLWRTLAKNQLNLQSKLAIIIYNFLISVKISPYQNIQKIHLRCHLLWKSLDPEQTYHLCYSRHDYQTNLFCC